MTGLGGRPIVSGREERLLPVLKKRSRETSSGDSKAPDEFVAGASQVFAISQPAAAVLAAGAGIGDLVTATMAIYNNLHG